MSVQISWTIPYTILQDPSYTTINIYRGKDETKESSYELIANIDRWINNDKTQEVDTYTDEEGKQSEFYYVRYKKDNGTLSKILLTVFELNPKELRWVGQLRNMLDPIITSVILQDGTMRPMSDTDLMLGINMALGFWNSYPPTTEHTITTYPPQYEYMLLMFAQYFSILNKMLGLELRDFSYSDNGLSLNQNFTQAIQNALSQILGFLNPLLQKTKMEFSTGSVSWLGSAQYSIGMNGRMGQFPIDLLMMFRSLSMN